MTGETGGGGWRERETDSQRRLDDDFGGADEGLRHCIMHRGSSARVACFMGWCQGCHSCFTLRGDGPVAMAAAKQLISKYYRWPVERERARGADFDGQQASNNRLTIDRKERRGGEGGRQCMKNSAGMKRRVGHVHVKWIHAGKMLIEIHPLYIYKASCAAFIWEYITIEKSRFSFWKKIASKLLFTLI